MTFRIGLTGSIAMGKSTTAALFAAEGIPIWDADACVHALYAPHGAATPHILALLPAARATDGSVSRGIIRELIATNPALLDQISAIVHPLVAADRDRFLSENQSAEIILLDIPLLFENHLENLCHGIAVVTAPPEVQRQRLKSRATMTDTEIDLILSRQMPDAEKRARATWVIETTTLDAARQQVKSILAEIREIQTHA